MRGWIRWVLILGVGCGGAAGSRDASGPWDPGPDSYEEDRFETDREVPVDTADQAGGEVPGEEASEDATTDLGPASWCDRWTRAWCEFRQRCNSWVSVDACRRAVAVECPASWLPWLEQQGRVVFDANAAIGCLTALETADCRVWWESYRQAEDPFPSCGRVLRGQRAMGDPCAWDRECPDNAWCDLSACPGRCQAFAGVGDACGLTVSCDPLSAFCREGTCATLPGLGDPCPEGYCRLPLVCDEGVCQSPAGPGEPCRLTWGGCIEGLVCVEGAPGEGTCQPPSPVGAPCFRHIECANPEGTVPLVCVSGRCREAPGPGEPCPDLICRDGWCESGKEVPICRDLPGEGEPCVQGSLCGPALWCREERCVPVLPDGQPCEGPWQCASGRCVAGTCRASTDLPCSPEGW